MNNYGGTLKYIREEKNLTQSALSKATGISQQMLSWWEAGKGLPNIDFCVTLAEYYGITLEELLGISEAVKIAPAPVQKSEDYSNEEIKLIEDYRALNPMNKKLIKQTMSALRSSAVATEQRQKNKNQN